MPDTLDTLLRDVLTSISDHNSALAAGRITGDDWSLLVARDPLAGHYAAYMIGRDTRDLSDAAKQTINATVSDQLTYLNGFAATIERDGWKDAYGARAMLYGGSIKESFYRGATWGWSLPYMPAQGTTCLSNCGCAWVPGKIDSESLTGEWYWQRGKSDSCPECSQREAETPIRFVDGERV